MSKITMAMVRADNTDTDITMQIKTLPLALNRAAVSTQAGTQGCGRRPRRTPRTAPDNYPTRGES